MATGNLGIKKKDLDGGLGIAVMATDPEDRDKAEQEKIHYPSFTLTNKHIEAAGLKDAQPDEVYEFTVRARVQSVVKKGAGAPRYDSNRCELEVQDISDVTMVEPEEGEDSDEKKDLDSKIGFDSKGMSKGRGSISPKSAGVALKR